MAQTAGVVAAPAVNSTVANLAPIADALAKLVLAIIASVAYGFAQKHVKDERARRIVLAAIDNGVSAGMNSVDGALKGHPLNVALGSAVAAQAVKYAQATVPDALAHLGLDTAHITKIAVAKLPGVDGAIGDDALKSIVAAANGKPPPMPATSDLAVQIIDLVRGAIANGSIKVQTPATPPAAGP
jgi:hypothetical protein